MPSINNENESDGDGEMSENESQHSNSSREHNKADSSEADEPDSDSSELDEHECERRTAGFVKYMGKNREIIALTSSTGTASISFVCQKRQVFFLLLLWKTNLWLSS